METTSGTRESKTMRTLEIYWDFSSPFAYLGSTQAESVAKRHGAELVWRPMLLGGVFKAIGQADVPLFTWSDAKRKYYYEDLHRWAAFWGVPFKFPSRFPMHTLKALRAYLALPEDRRDAYREKTFRAYWAEDRDIADDAVLRDCIDSGPRRAGSGPRRAGSGPRRAGSGPRRAGSGPRRAGAEPGCETADEVLARTQDPAVKKALVDATERAVKAGVFGAPTWIVDGEALFWGQDRIPLVERELAR